MVSILRWFVADISFRYRDVPGLNIPFTVNLTLTSNSKDPSLYTYYNRYFFPINGKGYGNWNATYNYHFTTEWKSRFIYKGGEKFTFLGDDDLWVFIGKDNQLSKLFWNHTNFDLQMTNLLLILEVFIIVSKTFIIKF